MRHSRFSATAAIVLAVASVAKADYGDTFTWDGSTGDWNTSLSWTPGAGNTGGGVLPGRSGGIYANVLVPSGSVTASVPAGYAGANYILNQLDLRMWASVTMPTNTGLIANSMMLSPMSQVHLDSTNPATPAFIWGPSITMQTGAKVVASDGMLINCNIPFGAWIEDTGWLGIQQATVSGNIRVANGASLSLFDWMKGNVQIAPMNNAGGSYSVNMGSSTVTLSNGYTSFSGNVVVDGPNNVLPQGVHVSPGHTLGFGTGVIDFRTGLQMNGSMNVYSGSDVTVHDHQFGDAANPASINVDGILRSTAGHPFKINGALSGSGTVEGNVVDVPGQSIAITGGTYGDGTLTINGHMVLGSSSSVNVGVANYGGYWQKSALTVNGAGDWSAATVNIGLHSPVFEKGDSITLATVSGPRYAPGVANVATDVPMTQGVDYTVDYSRGIQVDFQRNVGLKQYAWSHASGNWANPSWTDADTGTLGAPASTDVAILDSNAGPAGTTVTGNVEAAGLTIKGPNAVTISSSGGALTLNGNRGYGHASLEVLGVTDMTRGTVTPVTANCDLSTKAITVDQSAFSTNGNLTTTGDVSVSGLYSTVAFNGAQTSIGGALRTNGGLVQFNAGTASAAGISASRSGVTVAPGVSFTSHGDVNLDNSYMLLLGNSGPAQIWGGLNVGTSATSSSQMGVWSGLNVSSGMSISAPSTFTIYNSDLHVGGTLTNNGTIRGNGGIHASEMINNGTIAPGFSPGAITIYGDFVNNGVLDMQIGPTDHDELIVTGNATIGGTINIMFIDGYIPSPGDTFTLFSAGGTLDQHANITLPSGLGYTFQDGALTVVPEPGLIALLGASPLLLRRRRR